jgi:ubiquitin-protein ligase
MFQDEKFELFREIFFRIKIKFGMDFPDSAPKVKFLTRMFHPNIAENGVMELAILRENWNPTLDMKSVLDEIKYVLKNPKLDFDYCVNVEA